MKDFDEHLAGHLSDENRHRRYTQNSLIVDVAVELSRALDLSGKTQKELAVRLGKSEGFVSQVLSGGENLTLRTLGDFAWGLGCKMEVTFQPIYTFAGTCATEKWTSPQIERPEAANTQLSLAA